MTTTNYELWNSFVAVERGVDLLCDVRALVCGEDETCILSYFREALKHIRDEVPGMGPDTEQLCTKAVVDFVIAKLRGIAAEARDEHHEIIDTRPPGGDADDDTPTRAEAHCANVNTATDKLLTTCVQHCASALVQDLHKQLARLTNKAGATPSTTAGAGPQRAGLTSRGKTNTAQGQGSNEFDFTSVKTALDGACLAHSYAGKNLCIHQTVHTADATYDACRRGKSCRFEHGINKLPAATKKAVLTAVRNAL